MKPSGFLFHGTRRDFDRLSVDRVGDLGLHFGNMAQARYFAGTAGRIFVVELDIRRPLMLRDTFDAQFSSAQDTAWQLAELGLIDQDRLSALRNEAARRFGEGPEGLSPVWAALRSAIQEAGYDGVAYENENEDEGEGMCFIALSDHQVRAVRVVSANRLHLSQSVLEP